MYMIYGASNDNNHYTSKLGVISKIHHYSWDYPIQCMQLNSNVIQQWLRKSQPLPESFEMWSQGAISTAWINILAELNLTSGKGQSPKRLKSVSKNYANMQQT